MRLLTKILFAGGLVLGPVVALAAPNPPPADDEPNVIALKGQLLDSVQSELNWRTAYFNLQRQVGKLQAALATSQADLAKQEHPDGGAAQRAERPPGALASPTPDSPK